MFKYGVLVNIVIFILVLMGCGIGEPSPEYGKRNPGEQDLALHPQMVGESIQIALSDSKVKTKLVDNVYGKDYIVSEIYGGSEAWRIGIEATRFPSDYTAVIVIDKKARDKVQKLYVIVDVRNKKVIEVISPD